LKYKAFSHERGLKFFKKIGIFPEMSVSFKRGLYFLRGALDAAFPWVSSERMPIASSSLTLIEWRELFGAIYRAA